MMCLQLHSSLLPMHTKLKVQQHPIGHTTKLFWLSTSEPSRTVPQNQHFPSASPLRTKALPHSIVVAATAPAESGDLSAFLPMSALLLSVYFIANFIVPEFLTKQYGFDELKADQKVDDVNAKKDK
ncbi:uncharacterized protein LOC133288495 [Gastrolobium bilobum]|uniref:uncharacterized protein LOC133288495 n=1 Tax=Gastrolobium bilobum TaxID=150636 RepID=UPI002AB0FB02|nr:uncharacterized protein LOC133288495 [Gastrolobium bilobum]